MVIRMDQINKQTVSLSFLHPQSTAADASATESELAAINLKRKKSFDLVNWTFHFRCFETFAKGDEKYQRGKHIILFCHVCQ